MPSNLAENVDELTADPATMLLKGEYVLSRQVTQFERKFSRFVGVRHAIGVNSGTGAIFLALKAAGIGKGDRVLTQANTFHATVSVIVQAGASPVLVDAHPETFLMAPTEVEALADSVRAIVPVHLYGNLTPLRQFVRRRRRAGTILIEDAAQAVDAQLEGTQAGAFGDYGCFSFHPSKNLAAAGNGGAVTCHSLRARRRLLELRSLGQRSANEHVVVGVNSKLGAIQARILTHKLGLVRRWPRARRRVAASYRDHLADTPVAFQRATGPEAHVYHLFQIRVPRRDALCAYLNARGVEAVVRYPKPIHLQPAFAYLRYRRGAFPVAEVLSRQLLALPIRPDMTVREVSYVCGLSRRFFGKSVE